MDVSELGAELESLRSLLANIMQEHDDRRETIACITARIDVVEKHLVWANENIHDKDTNVSLHV